MTFLFFPALGDVRWQNNFTVMRIGSFYRRWHYPPAIGSRYSCTYYCPSIEDSVAFSIAGIGNSGKVSRTRDAQPIDRDLGLSLGWKELGERNPGALCTLGILAGRYSSAEIFLYRYTLRYISAQLQSGTNLSQCFGYEAIR